MKLVYNVASKQEDARRLFEEKVIICPLKTCYATGELKVTTPYQDTCWSTHS